MNVLDKYVSATLEALQLAPRIQLPRSFDGLEERLAGGTPAIAVLGLFNRGKSTLFNTLLGAPVSPISWEAETNTFVAAETGPEAATATHGEGWLQLPCEPAAFANAIARSSGAGWQLAEISGPFRIPPGLRLMDTPGLNEPGQDSTDVWLRNAVHGGIVVVSWPPGAAEQDLSLVRIARQALADNLGVVVNRVTSGTGDDQLVKIAAKVHAETGLSPVIVPPTPPTGPWGEDPAWKDIETLVERLCSRAGEARAKLLYEFHGFVGWVAERICEATWSEVDLAVFDRMLAIPHCSPELAAAVAHARDATIESRRAAARREEAAKARAREEAAARDLERRAEAAIATAKVALAEAQNWQPAGFWDRVDDFLSDGTSQFAKAGSAFRDVVAFAGSGSASAAREVQAILDQRVVLGKLNLSPVGLILALPAGQAQERGYQSASLNEAQRAELHRGLPAGALRTHVEHDLKSALRRGETGLAHQLKVSTDPSVKRRALEVLANDILDVFASLYGGHVIDVPGWHERKDDAVRQAESWLDQARGVADSSHAAIALLEHVAYARQHGHHWAARSHALVAAARERQRRALDTWTVAYVLSFVGWGIAVLIFFGDPGLSFFVWLGSFILWLVATAWREKLASPEGWRTFVRPGLTASGVAHAFDGGVKSGAR